MAPTVKEVHFFDRMTLTGKQRELCARAVGGDHPRPIIGYGGAGGGGKSYGLRAVCVYALLTLYGQGIKNQAVTLATTDYPRLADRHFQKIQEEYAWLGAKIGENAIHRLHVRFERAPELGVIRLRNLDDPDKYRGSEGALAAIDEPTELAEMHRGDPIMGLLLYPLRTPKGSPFSTLVMGFNPDGIGHAWVKGHFVTGELRKANAGDRYAFIEALHTDNPFIDEQWYENLDYLSDSTRKARLEGSWDAPKGQRWPTLSRSVHLFKFSDRFPKGIPERYPLRIGSDWGLRNPYAAIWLAVDEVGDIYVYREDYGAGYTAHDQAVRIRDLTRDNERGIVVKPDPAMWNESSREGRSVPYRVIDDYERILGADPRFAAITPAHNARQEGFAMLDRVIARGNGWPDLYIEENCTALWKELVEMQWDARGGTREWTEELDPRLADHAIDALRYGVLDVLAPALGPGTDLERAARLREERIRQHEQQTYHEQVLGGNPGGWFDA